MKNKDLVKEALIESKGEHNKKASRRSNLIFIIVAAVLCVVVLIVSLYIVSDKVSKALDFSRYDGLQITIYNTLNSLEEKPQEDNSYNQQTGTIDGDEANNEQANQQSDNGKYSVIKIDGDILYEESITGKYYSFVRDGKKMLVYYYVDMLENMGVPEDEQEGKWLEREASNVTPSFDVSVFENYEKSDFKKVNGEYYILLTDNDKALIDFLGISKNELEKYTLNQMKFYFDNGKVTEITIDVFYEKTTQILRSYKFTYEDEKLTIPEVSNK